MDGMLLHSCLSTGIEMVEATIEQEMKGMEYLVRVTFGNRKVIGYYTGTLMYTNLYVDWFLDSSSEERMMFLRSK